MSNQKMSEQFVRRQVLAGLFASVAVPAFAGAPLHAPRPKPRSNHARVQAVGALEKIIAHANLTGKVSVVVANADTGEVLESHNPELGRPPASVTKTVTTLYGLGALGPDYRFDTRIVATKPIVDGRVDGDIYLLGGGDPTLDTDALGVLAKRLKEAGLREVTGRAFVDGGALPYQKSIDPAQPDYLGYNPSLSGLNLNYNRVFFQWKRQKDGYQITMDARALKFRPSVDVATMKVVERRSPIFVLRTTPISDEWTVSKRALGRKGGRWLPVRRPAYYAADVFHTIAGDYGIVLPPFSPAHETASGVVLAEWKSAPLEGVLKRMLKYSTNITAEAVGLTASHKRGATPKTLRASGRLMTNWAKKTLGTKHAKFVDHSGLEDSSRISAHDMVRVLLKSGWEGDLHHLMKTIPELDSKGRRVKNSRLDIRAKTGTLNFTSALAGYVKTRGAHRFVFAVFAADLPRRSKIRKSERERPKGAHAWNRRAKLLQQNLIHRWASVFDA